MNSRFIYIVLLLLLTLSCNRARKQMPVHKKPDHSEERLVEVNRILVEKDKLKIQGFIDRMGWEMTETRTGLWYQVLEHGHGDSLKTGSRISFRYKVSLLDGTVCYDSKTDGIRHFTIGKGGVESGLEQGVLLLSGGDKARFIMPPYLAHGLTGDGNRVPARAIIIYEIELLP